MTVRLSKTLVCLGVEVASHVSTLSLVSVKYAFHAICLTITIDPAIDPDYDCIEPEARVTLRTRAEAPLSSVLPVQEHAQCKPPIIQRKARSNKAY